MSWKLMLTLWVLTVTFWTLFNMFDPMYSNQRKWYHYMYGLGTLLFAFLGVVQTIIVIWVI